MTGSAKIIDGKAFAAKLRAKVAESAARLKSEHGITAGLAVVLVGDDPASAVYVRNKEKMTIEVGMNSYAYRMPADSTREQILARVDKLNKDPKVNGILVQLPLPRKEDESAVIDAISPDKDVDGFHVINSGKLATGQDGIVPCTPLGCLMMLQKELGKDLSGKHAVVIGRSNIVGKPMAQLLLNANATVTIVHSRTDSPRDIVKQADIVVAAVGRPQMIDASWIKKGAVVIDVGINRIRVDDEGNPDENGTKNKLVGDVDFSSVSEVAAAITPVPGGVGPMTIACLLHNNLKAACIQAGIEAAEYLPQC